MSTYTEKCETPEYRAWCRGFGGRFDRMLYRIVCEQTLLVVSSIGCEHAFGSSKFTFPFAGEVCLGVTMF